jgi:hypothetical protein
VNNKVPQESWTGMKHNVAHLKVFGCVTYAHVPDELRKKLYNKGQKCIFFGYSDDTKAYKLYDFIARKVIISYDVQFMENEAWDGSIERIVGIIDAIVNDGIEEEVVKTPITSQSAVPGTVTQIPAQTTLVRYAGVQSTPRTQQTPKINPSSYTSLDPTLSILLPKKTRSLCDIYNVYTTNSFSVFSLFSQIDDLLTFEEVFKDDVWEQAMNE